MLVVQALACILFQMHAFDTNAHLAIRHIELDRALADDRLLVLRNLIAGGQIGIEIILAIENRCEIDLCIETETGFHRLFDTEAIDHRQHAGKRRIDEADLRIGRAAKFRRRSRKQFGFGGDLRMDFQPDDDLPGACGAVEQFGMSGGSAHAVLHHGVGAALNAAHRSMARAVRSTRASSKGRSISISRV